MTSRIQRLAVHCGILLVTVAVAAAGMRFLPFLELTENWLADFRIANLSRPQPQHPDIVILAVTEDTLVPFAYRSPLDRGFLDHLLRTLATRKVRAIGLDILFDQPTEPAKDAALEATLRALPVPLVVGYATADDGLTKKQVAYLDRFVPPADRGFANLVKDTLSGTVRAVYPGRRIADGTFVRGFAGALAAKLGARPPEVPVPIAWRAPPDARTPPFRTFPAHLLDKLPAAWFAGKVVLVGAELGMADRHRTPFSLLGAQGRLMAGVEIHAQALAQILEGSKPPATGLWGGIALTTIAAAVGIALAFIHANLVARAAVTVVALAAVLVGGFGAFRYAGVMVPIMEPGLALVIGLWLTDAYHGHRERRQRRFLKEAFSRYLSPVLVNRLVTDPGALALGGEQRTMSYLFTDIAGFTTLSERATPAEVSALLNAYLGGVCDIVFAHEGTIVDFIGDAVFAMFNAPIRQDDHAARAVACARDIDAFAEEFRGSELGRRLGLGITRIGVHTGAAAIGNMGAEAHFKYSPIGDSVNTASRIEGLNKHFGTRIAVSEETLRLCPGVASRPLGRFVVKGRSVPLGIHELLDAAADAAPDTAVYRRAYGLLDAGDAEEAAALFAELQARNPDDGCVALHLSRIREGRRDTVVVMQSK